jgi:general secretion pathway protein D
MRDTPTNLEMAADLIRRWDKPRAEVIVDLEIMEVSRQKLKQIGVDLDDASFSLRYAGPGASEDEGWYNLGDINLGRGSSYQISLPTALIRFLQTSADTKILAQPRLRGVADAEISTVVGQRVPIPTTTFTPIAAGGISQQPITSFTYEDVGLTIKIKPRIHLEKEVTLEIELKITALAGSGYADLPIIANREIKNTIRLKDGETSLLAGLLRDEERKSLSGIVGLASIPILGRLFSASDQRIDQSDLVLTITPYIIRSLERTAEDEKPLWIELEGISMAGRGERDLEEEPLLGRRGLERQPRAEETPPEEEEKPQEAAGDNQIMLDPANFEVPQNREFRLSVNVRCQQEIGNISLSLSFNPQVVRLKDVVEGGLVRQLGDKVPFLKNIAEGSATLGFSSPQLVKGFKGGGNLAVLVFEAAGPGETRVSVMGISANSPTGQAVNFTARESRILVR